MNDKIKSIIEVLYRDIVNGDKTAENNPISLALSRHFNTDIVVDDVSVCSVQMIGAYRKDNRVWGYCLGVLPFEVSDWLNSFYINEFCPPFSFQYEHSSPESAIKKDS